MFSDAPAQQSVWEQMPRATVSEPEPEPEPAVEPSPPSIETATGATARRFRRHGRNPHSIIRALPSANAPTPRRAR